MGWLYTQGQTRKALINHITADSETDFAYWKTLKRYCSGNTLFAVQEVTYKDSGKTSRFIGVYLMQNNKGYGWGYKDMDESCGPYQYGCPLSFFDMVPDPGGYATEWRRLNRENHARRFQKIKVEQIVRLTNGQDYRIISLRPLRGTHNGNIYRIPRRMLTSPKEVSSGETTL
jgi:hypothetical protein